MLYGLILINTNYNVCNIFNVASGYIIHLEICHIQSLGQPVDDADRRLIRLTFQMIVAFFVLVIVCFLFFCNFAPEICER